MTNAFLSGIQDLVPNILNIVARTFKMGDH